MADHRTFSFQEFGGEDGPFPVPVRVVAAGREVRTEASYRWDNARHRHRPFHVLQYTLSGQGELSWGRGPEGGWEGTRTLGPGTLFAASWNREFEYRHPGDGRPWEFLWIILEGDLADRTAAALGPVPVLALGPLAAPVLVLENFLLRLGQQGGWDRYALASVGCEFCLTLARESRSSGRTAAGGVGREAAAWVLEHLAQADTPSLAARFGYNVKYFSEYLRRHTGLAPHRFILEQKMRYACLMLAGTACTVGSLSAELGFAEDNYFSKVFRRHTGQAPLEYRRTHRDSLISDRLVALPGTAPGPGRGPG